MRSAALALIVGLAVTAASPGIAGAATSGGTPAKVRGSRASVSHEHRAKRSVPTVRPCPQAGQRFQMSCLVEVRADVTPTTGPQPQTPQGFGPSDLRSAYALPSSGGSGQTIAVVDAYDNPNAEADLGLYRSQFGIPACTTANGCFRKVNQTGGTSLPAGNTSWGTEIALDLDMASAICPNCKLLLVEANSASIGDLGAAVNTAVSLGAKYVSNSYAGSETSSDPGFDTAYFNHPGVAITASSGDSAYGTLYPAASRYVTAVGGTNLTRASNARGWNEVAWSGAGSGCSTYDAKPSWQADSACTRRTIADVSAVADPATGVAMYDTYGQGGWLVAGGTSVSAPIIAGVYAQAGVPAAGSYPASYPYAHPGSLFDVTAGSNDGCGNYLCNAQPGYDGPTGFGTPNGVTAFRSGGTPGNTVTVTNPGNQTGTVGRATSLQIQASDSAAGQTLAYSATGLPAGLSINASTGLISGTPTTVGASTVTVTARDTTGAGGSATFTWQINAAGGPCPSPGNKVVNGGFENGSVPWSLTPNVLLANGNGRVAHSGTHYAWLDGYGIAHTDVAAQTVTIPAGCRATLSFWLHVDTAERGTYPYDRMTVSLGGTPVAVFSNANATSGYQLWTIDVSAFAGRTVTLTFTGVEDSSLQTSFVLDDVALTAS